MGLDVYLYRVTAPKEQVDAENDRWEKESSRIFKLVDKKAKAAGRAKKWNDDDRAENERLQTEAAEKFGRVVDKREHYTRFDNVHERQIEIDSKLHPDHIFKVGYFRSSYNSGGIDRILDENLGTSLGEIMGYDDEYCFCPDWEAARERAVKALQQLRDLDAKTKYRAIEIDVFNPLRRDDKLAETRAEAVAIAEKKINESTGKPTPFGNDFSSLEGLFLLDSKPACVAYIPGKNIIGAPTVFGIVEAKPGDVFGFYIKALEIVVETCDYVLGTGHPEQHFLHWSG